MAKVLSIKFTEDLIEELKRRRIYRRVRRVLDDLKEMLARNQKGTIRMLYQNPVILTIDEHKVIKFKMGKYQLFYITLQDEKLIVSFDIKPRNEAYNKR